MPAEPVLEPAEGDEIRAIGDNAGSVPLKGRVGSTWARSALADDGRVGGDREPLVDRARPRPRSRIDLATCASAAPAQDRCGPRQAAVRAHKRQRPRAARFYRLPDAERARILAEHGRIGAIFAGAGYADDVRLECFGLDPDDYEFVIGLLGPRTDWLSRLVKEMGSTEQTARYIERLGPFYVGCRLGHTIRR